MTSFFRLSFAPWRAIPHRALAGAILWACLAVSVGFGQGTDWYPASVPTAVKSTLYGVASGATTYVAVGEDGVALTSGDADVWTEQTSGVTDTLNSVAWFSSQFVAVGANGVIITSANGVTWAVQDSTVTSALLGIVSSGTRLVTVGANGVILTSDDAMAWTQRTSPVTSRLRSVAWNGSLFVAVGDGGVALTSPDGVTWTKYDTPTDLPLLSVASTNLSGEVAWVAVGLNGVLLTSGNGATWTQQDSGVQQTLLGVASTGARLVAVGAFGTVLISETDVDDELVAGVDWTRQDSFTDEWLQELIYVAPDNLIAVGDTGEILRSSSSEPVDKTPVALSVNAPVVLNATATPPILGVYSTFSVRVTVNNADSTTFDRGYYVRLSMSDPSTGIYHSLGEVFSGDTLAANGSRTVQLTALSVDGQIFSPGSAVLRAEIVLPDSASDLTISGASVANSSVTIQGPDFSLSNPSFPNGTSASIGGSFDGVTYQLNNTLAGAVNAGTDIQVSVWLSADSVLSTGDDTLLDTYQYSDGLAAGPSNVPLPTDGRSINLPDSILGGNYFVIFRVNGNGAVTESGTTANTLAQAVNISYFDLAVTAPTLPTISLPDGETRKSVGTDTVVERVTLTVQNRGFEAYDNAEGYQVNLYLSADQEATAADALLASFSTTTALAALSSRQVTFDDVAIPVLEPGIYYLLAEVELPEGISDNSPDDNVTGNAVNVVGPDLGLDSLVFANGTTVLIGGSLDGVSYTLRNSAEGVVPTNRGVLIETYLSADTVLSLADDTLLDAYTYTDGLASGPASVALPLAPRSISMPEDVLGGAYYLLVVANRQGAILESDVVSNVVSGPITITAVDLAVTTPSISTDNAGVNTSISKVSTYVQNQGQLSYDSGYRVDFYLSGDDTLDAADRLLASSADITTPLGVLSSDLVSVDGIAVPLVAPGGYYVLAEVVPLGGAIDSNLANNALGQALTISGPDLALTNLNFPAGSSIESGGVFVNTTYRLDNAGIGAVTTEQEISIQVYLSEDDFLDPDADPLIDSYVYSGGIASGESVNLPLAPRNLTMPDGVENGIYRLIFVVNLNESIEETGDESNSVSQQVAIGSLDIRLTAPTVSETLAGVNTELSTVSFSLENLSGFPVSAGTVVNLYLSPTASVPASEPVQSRTIDTAFDSSRSVTFSDVPIGQVDEGTYYLVGEAILPAGFSDSNTANNVAPTAITVKEANLALIALRIPAGDQITLPGSFDDVEIDLKNFAIGVVPDGALVSMQAFLSDDDILDSQDLELTMTPSTDYSGGLDAYEETTLGPTNIAIPDTVAGGQKFLIFVANRDGEIPESSTIDNTLTKSVSLFSPDRIDLAIDYGYYESSGAGNWFSVQDSLASGNIAYQSPALAQTQSASIQTTMIGPTTFNAPWRIEADATDNVTVSIEKLSTPPATDVSTISGYRPVFQTNYITLPDSEAYTVTWTYNQGSTYAASFARLDLDIPVFTTGGDGLWSGGDDVTAPVGGKSVSAPLLDEGQEASFEVEIIGPALVSFWVKTDSDEDDTVSFLIDGTVQSLPTTDYDDASIPATFSGVNDWQKLAFLVQGGTHTLRWVYTKGSDDISSNIWIDALAVLKPVPEQNSPNRNDDPVQYANVPQRNVDLAIEDFVAEPGTYILDDSLGTGRMPVTLVVGSQGATFDIESVDINFASNVDIHLSLDTVYGNADDVNLGSYARSQIVNDGDKLVLSAEINLPFDTPAGNYNLIARFLPPPQIEEFSYTNNTELLGPNFVIVRAPDLEATFNDLPSGTYPYHPEDEVTLEYTISNRGLGTVTPDQPFDVTVQLMAIFRSFTQTSEAIPIKAYEPFDISIFLPEVSASFPTGGSSKITQYISLPTLRDVLVALGVIAAGTPEDSSEVIFAQDTLNDYVFYFQITLDSGDAIVESSETNTFSSKFTDTLDGKVKIATFFVYPTPGLENYGSFVGQLPFSDSIDEAATQSDLAVPTANADRGQFDNLSNLLEYAMATNPTEFTPLFARAEVDPPSSDNALGSYSVASLIVPPSSVPQDFLTMTFNFNVRAEGDITIAVQGSDDPLFTVEDTILELTPPYIDDFGPGSLTGFGGLKDNPLVLSVEGNVSGAGSQGNGGIQKVYSARVTVRDVEPLDVGDYQSRFMRVLVTGTAPVPLPPTDMIAAYDAFTGGVFLSWTPGDINDPAQGGAFIILRSLSGFDDFSAISSTTGTSYVDLTALPNTPYDYTVRLVNSSGATTAPPVATAVVP